MRFIIYIFLFLFLKSTILISGDISENTLESIIYPNNKNPIISFEEVKKQYHLPLNDAAKELEICTTVLKKICRKNGVKRWPYRQVNSLNNVIKYSEEIGDDASVKIYRNEMVKLHENPNIEYGRIIKKSKLNYINSNIRKQPNTKKSSSKRVPSSKVVPTVPVFPVKNTKMEIVESQPFSLSEPTNRESNDSETEEEDNTQIEQGSMVQNGDSETEEKDWMYDQENENKKIFNLSRPMNDATRKEFEAIKNSCKHFINYGRVFGDSSKG